MDADQLREDFRAGRIDGERLIDLLVAMQRMVAQLQLRIEELEKRAGSPPTAKLDEAFSLRAEERRQAARARKRQAKKKPLRRGRVATAEKLALAADVCEVFPAGVDPAACRISHTRVVWRLVAGRAVRVAYQVFRGPGNKYGVVPGVLGRSEFGVEFVAAIAYQVCCEGLSFDKVCRLMQFFQDLPLKKSQVDALLHQLARQWEQEFDVLAALLANSAVVHADETRWSLRSVWAFLSEEVRLVCFGVHKDAATLERVLDPAIFKGLVISDDAAVYANFTNAQKCWAICFAKRSS